ncbi:MAG: hypothetical protein FWB74_00225 [Defluviitaleaceae bacterium]|nr:hypothetical protein [Defluviitaleaceae bacterium]
MYITWEEAKEKYPNKWVILRNPQFEQPDFWHGLIGGEFVATANDQPEMFGMMPDEDDGFMYLAEHTGFGGIEYATFSFK